MSTTKALALTLTLALSGCSMSPNLPPKQSSDVEVYYNPKDVPFRFTEIGRIHLRNINYWADRDPGGQIKKIVKTAAKNGADAVIVQSMMRRESSGLAIDGNSAFHSGDVFQYMGVAIIKEQPGP